VTQDGGADWTGLAERTGCADPCRIGTGSVACPVPPRRRVHCHPMNEADEARLQPYQCRSLDERIRPYLVDDGGWFSTWSVCTANACWCTTMALRHLPDVVGRYLERDSDLLAHHRARNWKWVGGWRVMHEVDYSAELS